MQEPFARFLLYSREVTSLPADDRNRVKVDLYVATWLIESRLTGLSLLDHLCWIEHFCPSIYHDCIRMSDALNLLRGVP